MGRGLTRRARPAIVARAGVAFGLSAALVSAAGCGPVRYIGTVTREARRAVREAERAGAPAHAPYEYTLAVECLHKARELGGYARWQEAIRVGHEAADHGHRAARLALARGGRPDEAELEHEPDEAEPRHRRPSIRRLPDGDRAP